MQPNAVHNHSRGERVVLARDRLCQVEAAASFFERFTCVRRKHLEELSLHGRAFATRITAHKDVGIARFVRVFQHLCTRRRAGMRHLRIVYHPQQVLVFGTKLIVAVDVLDQTPLVHPSGEFFA